VQQRFGRRAASDSAHGAHHDDNIGIADAVS